MVAHFYYDKYELVGVISNKFLCYAGIHRSIIATYVHTHIQSKGLKLILRSITLRWRSKLSHQKATQFLRAILKNWEWPGDKAIIVQTGHIDKICCLCTYTCKYRGTCHGMTKSNFVVYSYIRVYTLHVQCHDCYLFSGFTLTNLWAEYIHVVYFTKLLLWWWVAVGLP